MKTNYIFENDDNKLRATALLRATLEFFNKEEGDVLGNSTVTISDKIPAFYVFDSEMTKHGNIGWRQVAKSLGEKFFGVKPDVRIVADLAEKYYAEALYDQKKNKENLYSETPLKIK